MGKSKYTLKQHKQKDGSVFKKLLKWAGRKDNTSTSLFLFFLRFFFFFKQDGMRRVSHLVCSLGCWIRYLNPSLGEVDPACKVFSDKSIWVMCPLKDSLQGLKLAAVEGGPVSPLLSFLLLFRIQLVTWQRRQPKNWSGEVVQQIKQNYSSNKWLLKIKLFKRKTAWQLTGEVKYNPNQQ